MLFLFVMPSRGFSFCYKLEERVTSVGIFFVSLKFVFRIVVDVIRFSYFILVHFHLNAYNMLEFAESIVYITFVFWTVFRKWDTDIFHDTYTVCTMYTLFLCISFEFWTAPVHLSWIRRMFLCLDYYFFPFLSSVE